MVATRDIEPGETIFQDTAAVVGPAAESLPLCLDCHSKVKLILKREENHNNASN